MGGILFIVRPHARRDIAVAILSVRRPTVCLTYRLYGRRVECFRRDVDLQVSGRYVHSIQAVAER